MYSAARNKDDIEVVTIPMFIRTPCTTSFLNGYINFSNYVHNTIILYPAKTPYMIRTCRTNKQSVYTLVSLFMAN